jgi:porin
MILTPFFAVFSLPAARATPPPMPAPQETPSTEPGEIGAEPTESNFITGLSRSSYLFGDLGGLRPALSKYGISLNITETSELLGNITGGVHQGAAYDGLTQAALQLDTEHAFHWYGGLFNVSALQIHGRNLSQDNLFSLQTASGIEADRATRLWELWYQQKFFDEDRVDVKIGQQSLDQEFMVSQNAGLFVNTMFGWPMLPSADLPGGGPAYPLSALGVRLRWRPTDSLTLLTGVFNGSPVSNNTGDPQKQNPSGTSFPLNGGALVIAELQYAYPSLGTMVYADESEPMARTYRIGVWYDSESFPDQEIDNTGRSLANPLSSGTPASHVGNYAFYGVADQMIWRSDEDPDRTASCFARVMGTPEEDRNQVDFSMNAGFTMNEPIPQRDDDTCGIGMGFAKVSNRASALDRDTNFYNGTNFPVRTNETFIEATYSYELTPWCHLQPDFQYVFNPGGGLANPNSPSGKKIKDEAIFGIRVNIAF